MRREGTPPPDKSIKDILGEMKKRYERGENVSGFLREKYASENTPEIIEIAYDLQAGSYTDMLKKPEFRELREKRALRLSAKMLEFVPKPRNILEAGVGEGNQLSYCLSHLPPVDAYGFDISWSRIAVARSYLQAQGYGAVNLFTGDSLHIPLADNSFDIVYTYQSIEPNRGKEEAILKELMRVTRGYLFSVEPLQYELASPEAQKRMDEHGYIKDLRGAAERLGLDVVEYEEFPLSSQPLNPTALMIVRKGNCAVAHENDYVFACPQFKGPLVYAAGAYYSEQALRVYPVIDGIPCLRIENGITASKYLEVLSNKTKEA